MSSESTSNGGVLAWFSNASRATLAVIGVVVVVVVLVLASWIGGFGPFGQSVSSSWSAVFLTDSEVFFGHVKSIDNDQIDLVNVYYLQRSQANTQTGSNQAAPTQLAILGLVANQIQCPKDEIIINRHSVLNIQTLQSSSYVVSRLNTLVHQAQKCFQPSSSSSTPAPATSPGATSPAATTPAATATPSASSSPSSSSSPSATP
jgi:hypothetical protein